MSVNPLLKMMRSDISGADAFLSSIPGRERQALLDNALFDEIEEEISNFPLVEKLLQYGADINYRQDGIPSDPYTQEKVPLVAAAIRWPDDNILSKLNFLLDNGLRLEDTPDALIWCVRWRAVAGESWMGNDPRFQSILRLLLESGLDPNWKDKYGNTALHEAASRYIAKSRFCLAGDFIPILLEYGADPHLKNNNGDTPIDIAARNGDTESVGEMKPSTA